MLYRNIFSLQSSSDRHSYSDSLVPGCFFPHIKDSHAGLIRTDKGSPLLALSTM